MNSRTILITGASSGIGRALARRFARNGSRLILVARRRERLEALADELGSSAMALSPIIEDLTSDGACERIAAQLEQQGAKIDVLVNNAGVGEYGEFASQSLPAVKAMLTLNLTSLVELTHRVLPDMLACGNGHVVNIASTAAFQPTPYFAAYGASKAFVMNFSMALWYELKNRGVSVTCICPGPVATEFFDRGGLEGQKQAFLKTGMTPERVAEAAYRAVAGRRSLVIPGWLNRLGAIAPRFAPVRLVTRATALLLKPRH
ncbi:MAG: SDR family oxidoreductase [Phycisphaerae bacterium]|nr:SDR family oxidoreductase [Phycisphaerae bacterium]